VRVDYDPASESLEFRRVESADVGEPVAAG